MVIDITGINKADLLAALFNSNGTSGAQLLHGVLGSNPRQMTVADAQNLLDETPDGYFDYVRGNGLKIDLSGDSLDTRLYDRDRYEGAGYKAIAHLLPPK